LSGEFHLTICQINSFGGRFRGCRWISSGCGSAATHEQGQEEEASFFHPEDHYKDLDGLEAISFVRLMLELFKSG
jgi:hypothetical protein